MPQTQPIDVLATLKRRPAVHMLCCGAYLQEPVQLQPDLWAIPLKALGFSTQSNYIAQYASEVAAASVDQDAVAKLTIQGIDSLPVVAIIQMPLRDNSPETLERESSAALERARRIIGWASGDEVTPFALLTCTTAQSYFRLLPPHSRRRVRLGFGNTGDDHKNQIERIYRAAETDEHFEYALSLLHDANQEVNPHFKIARLFNCLECLAYKIKAQYEGKSRKAVKALLGLPTGATMETQIDGEKFRFDVIEVAGRIRDKLFHGATFRPTDLLVEHRNVFKLLATHPDQIVSALLGYCELEIARWANGASLGLALAVQDGA
ncbi:MAG: hypothetical protein AABY68_13015 [Pseudomonadota bacterium]